ncbi:hypothetical protein BC826DRAFT_1027407, partial [Russula brevipes]
IHSLYTGRAESSTCLGGSFWSERASSTSRMPSGSSFSGAGEKSPSSIGSPPPFWTTARSAPRPRQHCALMIASRCFQNSSRLKKRGRGTRSPH